MTSEPPALSDLVIKTISEAVAEWVIWFIRGCGIGSGLLLFWWLAHWLF